MGHDAMHAAALGAWPGHGLGVVLMVLFWMLVVVGLVLLVRSLLGRREEPDRESELEALKRLYAEGSIDREEFLRRRSELER